MKRQSRSKAEARIKALKARIQTQIEGMASRAKVRVQRKGVWVADRVDQAMDKIERTKDERDRSGD
jgi:hypothetical protein